MKSINKKRILVHLHLFYPEQLDWFLSRLKNITCNYDLWVTVTENITETAEKVKRFKDGSHVLKVPNRGYDIYPFWLVLQKVYLSDYDAVLKIHTKNKRKTKWVKDGIYYTGFKWRNDLINPLIGTKRLFRKALKTLMTCDVGMVGSANLIGYKENPGQVRNTEILCGNMGITYFKECPFVCGTMFLIKSNLLGVFRSYKFKESDFSAQSITGSVGSMAHSLETIFGLIVADNGMKLVGVHCFNTLCKDIRIKLKKKYINFMQNVRKYDKDVDYIKHSKYFNKRWYLKKYPEFANEKMDPAQHYLIRGWELGMNPGPVFNTKFYINNHLDVKKAKINPLLHYEKYGKYEGRIISKKISLSPLSVKEYYDVVKSKRAFNTLIDKQVIISLTTFPGRIGIVHKTVQTLKNQSFKADKIILYLSEQEFPKRMQEIPETLKKLQDNQFEIHWIKKTLFSFQKLVPALKEYPDAIIVTVDDDVLYDHDWLKALVMAYQENPNVIHCHRVHRIIFKNGNVSSYNDWKKEIRNESIAYNNFLTGVGGVLYPPHCLDEDVLKDDVFLEICPKADDIWFWGMALKKHTKIHVLKENISALDITPGSQDGECLCKINTGEKCYNDIQLQNVFEKYPEIFIMINKERKNKRLQAYLFYPYYLLKFFGNKRKSGKTI